MNGVTRLYPPGSDRPLPPPGRLGHTENSQELGNLGWNREAWDTPHPTPRAPNPHSPLSPLSPVLQEAHLGEQALEGMGLREQHRIPWSWEHGPQTPLPTGAVQPEASLGRIRWHRAREGAPRRVGGCPGCCQNLGVALASLGSDPGFVTCWSVILGNLLTSLCRGSPCAG